MLFCLAVTVPGEELSYTLLASSTPSSWENKLVQKRRIWTIHNIHCTLPLEASALDRCLALWVHLQVPVSSSPPCRLGPGNTPFPTTSEHAHVLPWPSSFLALVSVPNPVNFSLSGFSRQESNTGLCEPPNPDTQVTLYFHGDLKPKCPLFGIRSGNPL